MQRLVRQLFNGRETVEWEEISNAWFDFRHSYTLPLNDPKRKETITVRGIPDWMCRNSGVFVIEREGELLVCLKALPAKKGLLPKASTKRRQLQPEAV